MDLIMGEICWCIDLLVFNGEFFVYGDYIVSGYGFIDECDYVFVVL